MAVTVRIRLTGTRRDVTEMVTALGQVLNVVQVSDFYPHRGASKLGRVYLDVTGVGVRTGAGTVHASAERADNAGTPRIQRRPDGGELR